MKIKYLLAAAIVSGLAACSSDEPTNTGTEKDNTALFTGSIEGAHTRAYDQKWDPTDQIGITGTSGAKVYTNLPYKYAGSGDETFTAAANKIYYQDGNEVQFTAYYPWSESLTAATTLTTIDTRKQADQKKFDFLYATATGSKGVSVSFTFAHKMAKLVLTVKAGEDMTYSDVESAVCSLKNLLPEGTFDRTTGTATATDNPDAEWTFANNSGDTDYNTPTVTKNEANKSVAYTLILFPQTFPSTGGNLTFAATTGGNSYSAEIDLSKVPNNGTNELKPGTQYNITINLNKTGLTVGTSTISQWTEMSHEINAGM
ncbi:fimbrillin family protein [Bacteroides intestinalis]|uniref:fimbrillin family protein n=1 Tax=Bacteroides intestinalis TaxID=329854 RepID=UPI00189F5313|nr:fimbrillin family protein [Bacteroides intestinalis]